MDGFIPHSIDEGCSYEGEVLGDVKAGFPSPAENIHEKLDLIRLLVRHRASTFFFRVDGVSMVDSGMDEGDIIDGEYTVKRVEIGENSARLMPANEKNTTYRPIEVTPENNFLIWGIVTWVIKKM